MHFAKNSCTLNDWDSSLCHTDIHTPPFYETYCGVILKKKRNAEDGKNIESPRLNFNIFKKPRTFRQIMKSKLKNNHTPWDFCHQRGVSQKRGCREWLQETRHLPQDHRTCDRGRAQVLHTVETRRRYPAFVRLSSCSKNQSLLFSDSLTRQATNSLPEMDT